MKIRTVITACALLLCGCKVDPTMSTDSAAAQQGKTICPNGTVVKGNKSCPITPPSPPPPPPPTTTTVTVTTTSPNGVVGETPIADNFDTNLAIEAGPGVPI